MAGAEMKITGGKAVAAGLVMAMFLAAITPAYAGEELPSIQDLIKPAKQEKATTEVKAEEPKYPRRLQEDEMNIEASAILPANPCLFLQTDNGLRTCAALDGISLAKLEAETSVQRFLRDNPFSLADLFVDLPAQYSNPDSLNIYVIATRLARAFARVEARFIIAAYKSSGSGISFAFLAEIGKERKEAFEKLESLRDAAMQEYPGLTLQESPREDDFVDVLRSDDERSELAIGIVRKYVLISTSAGLARNLIKVAREGGGASLGSSPAYQSIAQRTDASAHIRGFIDLPALINEVIASQFPSAFQLLNLASDIAGRGVIYYDLKADGERAIEHMVNPTEVRTDIGELPGVPARILGVCAPPAPEKAWTTTKIVPYQPDFFFAARVLPDAFRTLIFTPSALGSSEFANQISGSIPKAIRDGKDGVFALLKQNIDEILDGEIALALLPAHDNKRPWIMSMALKSGGVRQAMDLMPAEGARKVGELNTYTLDPDKWESEPCWAVLEQASFLNLSASQLVIASSGELLSTIADQAILVAASLEENKDFKAQVESLGKQQSLIFYINLPAMISREYVNFSAHVKHYFPHMATVSSRPPMNLVARHLSGIAGGVEARADTKTCLTALVSPSTTVPLLTALLVTNTPQWIRERTREYMKESRMNLGKIWLALQTFATQRGHYPESIDALRGLFGSNEQREVFVNSAAVEQRGLDEAVRNSYTYLPNTRPTDEPDRPIVYESRPWHYEYRDMMQPQGEQPVEGGPYLQWHLVLQIDGTIRAYTEDDFRTRVLPRITNHE